MLSGQNEAFSRVLIDKALGFSGWDLLNPQQAQFESHTSSSRADYLLKDSLGRVLCVLEAKREDLDPYDAKEQARGYAENLKAPFIILSNGREHWIWNYERADQRAAYRIERLPSRDDLERLRLKNLQPPRPLGSEVLSPGYPSRTNMARRCIFCTFGGATSLSGIGRIPPLLSASSSEFALIRTRTWKVK